MTSPYPPPGNYYSDKAIQVATDAIREQARNWGDLATRMDDVRQTYAGFGLSMSAFCVLDLMTISAGADLANAYHRMHEHLLTLFAGAAKEFDNFSVALNKAADWYEESDQNSVVRMNDIYGEAD